MFIFSLSQAPKGPRPRARGKDINGREGQGKMYNMMGDQETQRRKSFFRDPIKD